MTIDNDIKERVKRTFPIHDIEIGDTIYDVKINGESPRVSIPSNIESDKTQKILERMIIDHIDNSH